MTTTLEKLRESPYIKEGEVLVPVASSKTKEPRTLIVSDVHGNYDRLRLLLAKARVVDFDSEKRINHDVRVIQLGDLIHAGRDNPSGDLFCITKVEEWFDDYLWGNHDYAVVNSLHAFSGYRTPSREICEYLLDLMDRSKVKFAASAHGWLITHAGLHKKFDHIFEDLDRDTEKIAERLNEIGGAKKHYQKAVVDAVGFSRHGRHRYGGILWRDFSESTSKLVKQVYGHTSQGEYGKTWPQQDVRKNWCIDIGTRKNGLLAGIWLPDEEVVTVNTHVTKLGGGYKDLEDDITADPR